MSANPRWPVIGAASALALGAVLVAGGGGPLRLVLALWFLLVCTGMAFVPLASIPVPAVELAVGVAASVVIDTIVATAIVWVGGLSAAVALVALALVCTVGWGLQLRAPARQGG